MSLYYGYEEDDINFGSGTGEDGDQGPPGPQGAKGDKGDRGLRGISTIGPKGSKGDTGAKGNKGDPGSVGNTGLTGNAGVAGPQGPTGIQGLKGDKGDKGDIGLTGQQGSTGRKGPTGTKGNKGDPGSVGNTGLTGNDGVTGPIGPRGLQGVPGSQGLRGTTGHRGIQGPLGPTGPAGPQGPQGVKGDIGPAGSGINHLFKYENLGKRTIQSGDFTSAKNTTLLEFTITGRKAGKYLLKYYFLLKPTDVEIDQEAKKPGWTGSYYITPAVLKTYVYIGNNKSTHSRISSSLVTTNGAVYDSSNPHWILGECIVNLVGNDKVTLQSHTDSFGDIYSYIFYDVHDVHMSLLKIG